MRWQTLKKVCQCGSVTSFRCFQNARADWRAVCSSAIGIDADRAKWLLKNAGTRGLSSAAGKPLAQRKWSHGPKRCKSSRAQNAEKAAWTASSGECTDSRDVELVPGELDASSSSDKSSERSLPVLAASGSWAAHHSFSQLLYCLVPERGLRDRCW